MSNVIPQRRTWIDSEGIHHLESSSHHGNARVSVQLSLGSGGIFSITHNDPQTQNETLSSKSKIPGFRIQIGSPSGKPGIQLRADDDRRKPANIQSFRLHGVRQVARKEAKQPHTKSNRQDGQAATQNSQKLFCSYDQAWRSLSPKSTHIPFPTIDLSAASLQRRDALAIPHGVPSISDWAMEVVVQANVQVFMLGAVGMSPQYTFNARTRQLHTGFDTRKVSAGQLGQLIEILKRERTRWHPDQLNRRFIGEDDGADTKTRGEDAKAVYLAVCDLLDLALRPSE